MATRLFKSTSIVASMTMLSRILGFVRDMIFASVFGASAGFDAFVIAFKIPNFFRRLFGEGAFSQAFVPVLAEFRARGDEESVKAFVNRIAGSLGLALLVLVAIVELIAPLVIMLFAPGFIHHPTRFKLATHLLHLTFPYLFFIGLTAFCGAVLNTFSQFAIPAFTPVLLNLVFIGVALLWAPHAAQPIIVLGWGVMIAGAVQLAIQLPFLARLNLLPKPQWGFSHPGVRRVLKLMVPALFGVSVAQISLLIDNFFASFLPAGSISWLYFSDRLTYLPLGVIGVAIATVVLPNLSRHHNNKSPQQFSNTIDWALRLVLITGFPAAVGLFMLSGPLLATLIHHGHFNNYDVIMTRKSLMAFALGLPGFMLVKILASGFYSQQNIKTPVKIAVVAVLVNLAFNIILIKPMAHAGLALSTSIASAFNAIALLVLLIKQKTFKPSRSWPHFSLQLVVANVMMAIFLYWQSAALTTWLGWGDLTRVWHLISLIVGAILIYGVVLIAMGLRVKHLRLRQ